MKIIDRDNHGAFDEHISDDNDGNDEASFDSGESAHKYLAGAPLFLCCFIDMIWQANNPVTTASITYSAHRTKTKYPFYNIEIQIHPHQYKYKYIHKQKYKYKNYMVTVIWFLYLGQ